MRNKLWKNWFLCVLGLWIIVLPWTGFPGEFKTWLYVLSGLCVISLSFSMARSLRGTNTPLPSMPGEDDEMLHEEN